jgi:hypothetical protein
VRELNKPGRAWQGLCKLVGSPVRESRGAILDWARAAGSLGLEQVDIGFNKAMKLSARVVPGEQFRLPDKGRPHRVQNAVDRWLDSRFATEHDLPRVVLALLQRGADARAGRRSSGKPMDLVPSAVPAPLARS